MQSSSITEHPNGLCKEDSYWPINNVQCELLLSAYSIFLNLETKDVYVCVTEKETESVCV